MSRKMLSAVAIYLITGMFAATVVAQTPGTWEATGSMSIGRQYATATLLPNGKVLVAGGIDAGGSLNSAELYDPSTRQWVTTGAMTTRRGLHRATLLPNGKVLVAGGQTDYCTATDTTELYDPITGTWSGTGSLNDPRTAAVAALVTEGPLANTVLVAGGDPVCAGGPAIATAEVYDLNTGTWSRTGSMNTARNFGPEEGIAPVLPSGSILAIGGGTCCPYRAINSAELFDPLNESWTRTNKKKTTAQGPAALMTDGRVLVAGGASGVQPNIVNVATAELFDSSGNTWTPTASMSTDRAYHTLTLLASGQVLVSGGFSGGWGVCNDLSSAELYDSISGAWFLTGGMSAARNAHIAMLLPNGQVLVAGGGDCEGNILSSAELYTPPPVATLSTTSLKFGVQLVNTRSAAQAVTLTNTGTTTLTISSITANGDFLQKNNCGTSVSAGGSCTIKVAFSPNAKGVRTGTVTITDDAANSPQTIALTGTGTVVEFSSGSLDFGNQPVGTTSSPQTVTVTNVGAAPLHISGIGITGMNFGDFLVESTTCGSRLPGGASCTISVVFSPKAIGSRQAFLVVGDNGGGSPQRVALAGTGT